MQASAEQLSRSQRVEQTVDRAYQFADLSDYSFKQRWMIRAADLAFYLVINLIGMTARFEVIDWENHDAATRNGGLPIYNFWHDRIFLTTYWWRHRRIVGRVAREGVDGGRDGVDGCQHRDRSRLRLDTLYVRQARTALGRSRDPGDGGRLRDQRVAGAERRTRMGRTDQ